MKKSKAMYWLKLLYKSDKPEIRMMAYNRLKTLIDLLLADD